MKKLTAVLLILILFISSAGAAGLPKEEDLLLSYNAWAGTLGAESIEKGTVKRSENIVLLPGTGYEILFFLTDDSAVEQAGVRLISEDAAGDFLLANMALISLLGEMDYTAFGTMLVQYGSFRRGETDIMPGFIGKDAFSVASDAGDYKAMFVYLNNDLKESW